MGKQVKLVPLRLIISYFLPPVKKYKKPFIFCFIGFGISYLIGGIIQPLYYKKIMDIVALARNGTAVGDQLKMLVWTIAGIVIIKNVVHRATDFVMVYSQSNILKELSDYTFTKLQNQSYQFFVSSFAGSLVAKSRRFVKAFETLHDNSIFAFWQAIIQLSGIFFVLFMFAPFIAWFFAVWGILFIFLTAFLVQKKRKYDLEEAAADSRKTGGLADAFTGILNIKMFSSEKREIELFEKITANEEHARRTAWNFGILIHISHSVIWSVLEIAGLYMIVSLWIAGNVSAGMIVLITSYFAIISGIMWNLRSAIGNVMRAISDASEMVEIFEKEPDILDLPNPDPCLIKEGKIVFDRVSFGYGGNEPVFNNFNLIIEAGEKIGLVGPSGGGKSTVTKLLLRFIDVLEGEITIDGQRLSRIRQNDLRNNIAYVPQDPILFHRSLKENIAYGRPGAKDEEIFEVAEKANAHEFIAKLPNGYGTFVGERGVKLSGGERQKIAIARAMLKNAPILILDEATSSLDSLSEKSVLEAFSRLMEGKTTIIIAHRLSTIRNMKRIIVLNDGRIIEEGCHQDLLEKKGMYYQLWDHQSTGFAL